MTGYQSGMRRHRITILNRNEATKSQFGRDAAGITWSEGATVWAAVDWTRGMSAMREGSLDAYGAIIVRIDYTTGITMRSRIRWNGQVYQILPETFHADYQANTIQFHAQVIVTGYSYGNASSSRI